MVLVSLATASESSYASPLWERENVERKLAFEMAPVKSLDDLIAYLNSEAYEDSPLGKLSAGAQQRFLESLVFTDRGLGSFSYQDLRNELTVTEIYQVLSIFGSQRVTTAIPGLRAVSDSDNLIIRSLSFPDKNRMMGHAEYWCSSRVTCSRSASQICTSNC